MSFVEWIGFFVSLFSLIFLYFNQGKKRLLQMEEEALEEVPPPRPPPTPQHRHSYLAKPLKKSVPIKPQQVFQKEKNIPLEFSKDHSPHRIHRWMSGKQDLKKAIVAQIILNPPKSET